MPTQTEFDEQKETYAEALKEKLEPKPKEEEKDEEVETMVRMCIDKMYHQLFRPWSTVMQ